MSTSPYTTNRSPLQKEAFIPLPLGAVRPAGWLKDQLNVQADGQSGHLDEFWESLDSRKTAWLGGDGEAWERGPYFMDGLVPLAFLTGRGELLEKVRRWCGYQLAHQRADGHLGPEALNDWWPYAVLGKVLMQYAQASGDERVAPALLKFARYQLERIDQNPLREWAAYRVADQVVWLHRLYNLTGEAFLLDLAGRLRQQAYDWTDHFSNFTLTGKTVGEFPMRTHVVNTAMGIKSPGVWWVLGGDPKDRQGALDALANLEKYHGTAAGIFTGDEHLAGKAPTQGTELCAVVEEMYSLENLLSFFGDPAHGDLLERMAYNALPGTFSPDMRAHQYDQQANQALCSVARREWTNNSPTSNLFGLEPNYGCCTANQHQGWPKLVAHLWMAGHDGGLAAIAYGPCEVAAKVADGVNVKLSVHTLYPFDEKITITVQPERAATFPLHLRIPAWAKGAKLKINGKAAGRPKAGTFHKLERLWQPGDKVELTLPMTIRVKRRYGGAVAIHRGPLVYSLKIGEQWNALKRYDQQAADYEVRPTTPWNYGLLLDEQNPAAGIKVESAGQTGPRPFDPADPPVCLKVTGRRLPQWTMVNDQAGPVPENPTSIEPVEELTLIPYGIAKLRITEFPVLKE